jgi:hypothetical protein
MEVNLLSQKRLRLGAGTPWSCSRCSSSRSRRFIADFLSDADSFILVARYSANLIRTLSSFKVSFAASLSVSGAFDRVRIYGIQNIIPIADLLISKS